MSQTVQQQRNAYRTIMTACLGAKMIKCYDHLENTAARFNDFVSGQMHEDADGEPYEKTPARFVSCAQRVAFEIYNVDYRTLTY